METYELLTVHIWYVTGNTSSMLRKTITTLILIVPFNILLPVSKSPCKTKNSSCILSSVCKSYYFTCRKSQIFTHTHMCKCTCIHACMCTPLQKLEWINSAKLQDIKCTYKNQLYFYIIANNNNNNNNIITIMRRRRGRRRRRRRRRI